MFLFGDHLAAETIRETSGHLNQRLGIALALEAELLTLPVWPSRCGCLGVYGPIELISDYAELSPWKKRYVGCGANSEYHQGNLSARGVLSKAVPIVFIEPRIHWKNRNKNRQWWKKQTKISCCFENCLCDVSPFQKNIFQLNISGEDTSSTTGNCAATFMNNTNDSVLMALMSTQKGFILSMRSIPPDLTGDGLCEYFGELFPPTTLFQKGFAIQRLCGRRYETLWTREAEI